MPQPRHWFWSAISQSWPIYGEALVASLLINLFALVTPFFTMNVYDRVVPNLALETLWVLTIGVALVFGFDFLMRTLRAYFIDVAGKRVDVILSANIFARVLGIRMDARPASVGAFANNVQEFESFREFVTSATITTLVDLPFALLFIAAMAWIGGPIACIPLAAVPLIVGFGLLVQVPLSRVVQESFRHASQRQATLVESLAGLETLRTQRAEGPAQRRWEQAIGQIAKLGLRARFLSSVVINFASFVQQLAYVAVVVCGVYLIRDERLTVGGLIACTLLTGRVLAPLAQIAGLLTRWHQARTALMSIDRIMTLPIERPVEHNYLSRPRLRGGIEFRDVTFGYPGQQVLALRNVSFRIAPGERVALIGRIGSGKTTIEKLVLGLYSPNSGSILIDGIDARQIDPGRVAPRHRLRASGHRVVLRNGPGQHRARRPALGRRGGAPRGGAGRDPRVHRSSPARILAARRRARRRTVRRPAAGRSPWRVPTCSSHRCFCSTSRAMRWTTDPRKYSRSGSHATSTAARSC